MGAKHPRNQGLVADSVLYARSSKMHRACFFTLTKNDESQSRKKSRVLVISRGMVNDSCSSVMFIKSSSSSPQSTSQLAVARLRTSQRRPSIGFSAPNHRNFSECRSQNVWHRKDLPGANMEWLWLGFEPPAKISTP